MIKLTDVQDNAVYINPDRVIGIHLRDDVGTRVDYGGESYVVRESPEEVARKVLEWRLAMADYQDSSGVYRQMMRETLEELAGLHGKNLDAFVDGIIKRMEEQNHDEG